MNWVSCPFPEERNARFGHTTVAVDSSAVWGSELAVVFGGVSESFGTNAGGAAGGEHHTALQDVQALQVDAEQWFTPEVTPGALIPDARAFHCAAALERKMYVFGGHGTWSGWDPALMLTL